MFLEYPHAEPCRANTCMFSCFIMWGQNLSAAKSRLSHRVFVLLNSSWAQHGSLDNAKKTTNSVEVFRFYGWIGVTLGGTGLSPKRSKSQTSAAKWRICCKISPTPFFRHPSSECVLVAVLLRCVTYKVARSRELSYLHGSINSCANGDG